MRANKWLIAARLEMQLVFELPAQRAARFARRQSEQDAAVHLEAAGTQLADIGEQLRADAMVLLTQRREMTERARRAIGLDARLDDRAEREPAFDRVGKHRPSRSEAADILFDEQV